MPKENRFAAFTLKWPGTTLCLKDKAKIIANGKEYVAVSLWDTGASATCISTKVAEELALVPTGMKKMKTPSGEMTVNTYLVNIVLPNNVEVPDVEVCDSEIGNQGLGLLIGMNIITLGDFSVSNLNDKTTFSFRIPSKKETDFVKEERVAAVIGPPHGKKKRKKKK